MSRVECWTGSSHRPVLPPMDDASKARRLLDCAQRRIRVDSGDRATYPADQRHGGSRRLRQDVSSRHRLGDGQCAVRPGRLPTPTPTARADADGTDGSVAGHRERRRPRTSVAVTSAAGCRCGRRPGSAAMCIGRRCTTAITPAKYSTYGEARNTPARPLRYSSTFRAGRGCSEVGHCRDTR